MSTTILVSAEGGYLDGLLIGNPTHVFTGEAFAGDSNSNSSRQWDATPVLDVATTKGNNRLIVVVTDEAIEFIITGRTVDPATVTGVPVVPADGGRVAYSCLSPGGRCKLWIRRFD